MAEIRKYWRKKQHSSLFDSLKLSEICVSPCGIPLNPRGRQGIMGRGDHVKFGPNYYCIYVIMHGKPFTSNDLKVIFNF